MIAGVRLLSQGPGSGLGDAAELYLTGLRSAGVPVTWTPLSWPSAVWNAPYGPIADLAGTDLATATHADVALEPIEHDTVVVCSTPLWHERLAAEASGRRLVAYTAWETDRLPDASVAILNRYDQVLVPSRFNAAVFEASGVTSPVTVVPHIAATARHAAAEASVRTHAGFVFYLIATWTTRKAILDAVAAFADAFTAEDDAALIIHTTPDDQIARRRIADGRQSAAPQAGTTWFTLAQALGGRPSVPEIVLSTRRLTRGGVLGLHERGDCFFSLSRGEGWGLGAFEAGAAGNPAILTGWGGSLEFLPPGYPYCVDYDLVPTVTEEPDAWWDPRPGERWARARRGHASQLLRQVFDHRDEAASWGRALQRTISARFAGHEITARLIEALDRLPPPQAHR